MANRQEIFSLVQWHLFDNVNRRAATQSVTEYVVTKLRSNYGGFSG